MKTANRSMMQNVMPAALAAVFAILLTMISAGSVYAADEDQYIFGTVRESSTFSAGEFLEDSFCYSDQWFLKGPEERNDALALLSMQLSAAATTDGQENGNGAALLKQLGFEDMQFTGFQSEDPEDMAYTCAVKTAGEGDSRYTIIAVAVQSYSTDDAIKKKRVDPELHGKRKR